jgi:hypothetical protein
MRPCLLIRMLYWPRRERDSFSKWLAGGTRRSLMARARLSIQSFRSATEWMSRGSFFETRRYQISSVSESRKDRIMLKRIVTQGDNTVKRQ